MTRAALPFRQMNPREAAQRELRLRQRGIHVPEINLRHLVAVARAGIFQREGNFYGVGWR